MNICEYITTIELKYIYKVYGRPKYYWSTIEYKQWMLKVLQDPVFDRIPELREVT